MSKEVLSSSFDTHLEMLGDVDRRRLLLGLQSADAASDLPLDIDQLEYDTAARDHQLRLRHVHLPKLAKRDFIEVRNGSVRPGPRFEEIEPLLELLDSNREQLPDDWV